MKNWIFLLAPLMAVMACKKDIESLSDMRSDFFELQNRSIRMGDTLTVKYQLYQSKIDSVSFLMNGKHLPDNSVLSFDNAQLGLNKLEINVYTTDGRIYGKTEIGILSGNEEKEVEYEMIKTYPHSKDLFTQGFFFHDGKIYESSGQYGKSKLVSYSLGSEQFSREFELGKNFFAEGATLFKDKIWQLTYRERKIFVYNPDTFELINTLDLPAEIRQGWGLTTNGEDLIFSDGSQNLYFFDENLQYKKRIQVAGFISVYTKLNELEYIKDKIFANVWQTDYILVINPESGEVEHFYDLSELSETKGSDDVLNGIALYNNHLLVTGKNWTKISEITLPEGF